MRVVADLHLHSKYARGTSPKCDIRGLAEGAKIKGINLIATGDFTHPAYFQEIRRELKNESGGVFPYRGVNFILSTELSVIYQLNGKTKKMHHVVMVPSLDIAEQVIDAVGKFGDLRSDGRPMLKMSSAQLADELFSISEKVVLIPAHVWTPWFSLFGSSSGVDSVEEAFEEHSRRIFALETGLSSDPEMNWMLSSLDRYALVSNSDAHSLEKLGREANVLELPDVSYDSLVDAIKSRRGFAKTYEFYPEEGKYHYDGHRKCGVVMSPQESIQGNLLCPVCRKKLTIGVLHRIVELADRKQGFHPENAVDFQYTVPLTTVISRALGKGEKTKSVLEEYSRLIRYFGSEFSVYEAKSSQIRLAASPEVAEALIRVMEGRVRWVPGHDGVFGKLILGDNISKDAIDKKQSSLDDF
ncbi:DNA helicase UvrD [Candidatus Micrarchaeota archaeon]|nr:DNA helicase UvrD [Candidatus Micrarchaeota archaeon]